MFKGRDTVWKLKRAVRLPFLDFTTVEQRRQAMARELALNRPTAPGLYRDMAALVRRGGALQLEPEPDGKVVDWVLRMAPIPDGDILLDRVGAGFDPPFLDALADAVAADHATRPAAARYDPAGIMANVRGNAESARQRSLPPEPVAAWLAAAEAAVAAGTDLLAARAQEGRVRRAHGDLHLGNLCLWQGRIVPFDAIEFSEAMATIDLGYDLAFLLMDLEFRCGRPAANRVLNRYVARTGDAGLAPLLPLFLSRRAMVRAHVTGEAAYLDMALRTLHPPRGRVVAIGGLPGTGKSTLARALAPALGPSPGALVLRSDEIRKRLHGVPPEARLPRGGYNSAGNARTNAAFLAQAAAAVPHAVILDATFLNQALRARLDAFGPGFTGLWLDAPLDELRRRVAARAGDASDATPDVLDRLARLDPGPVTWHRIPADGRALERCRTLLNLP